MKSRVKRVDDPRYKNTQNRFNRVIENFVRRGQMMKLRASIVCTRAKVNPSTFYNHYSNMDEAVDYMNSRMMDELKSLKIELGDKPDLEIVFLKVLFFIYKNRDYYEISTHCKNVLPLAQIADIFRPEICQSWRHYKKEEINRIFQIYKGEFAGLIIYWGQSDHFKKIKIPCYARKLARFSKTACERLR